MTTEILHLRSAIAQLRPNPASLLDGQLMLNTNAEEAGVYFRLSDNSLARVGGIHVGTTPPNASAAGHSGNSEGEAWVDTTDPQKPLFKVYEGGSWFTVSTEGLKGEPGVTGNAATVAVGTTTTLEAGESATVSNSGSSSAATFNFGIPQGVKGEPGAGGSTGTSATVDAGTATALGSNEAPTVSNSGTTSAAVFDFGIPAGDKGEPGAAGADGSDATVNLTNVLAALSISSYVDDTAAHTAGLANGDIYWNTTDNKLRAA
jgi:hypothetical protein